MKVVKTESEVPIYTELHGLDQDDPKLISAIYDKVLWRPPYPRQALNIVTSLDSVINGQYGQPKFAENVLRDNNLFRTLYESEAVGLFAKQYECLLTQFRSSNKSQKE